MERLQCLKIDSSKLGCTIDKARCAQWLAGLILEGHTVGEQTMVVTIFLDMWKAQMPDAWRDNATLDSLQVRQIDVSITVVLSIANMPDRSLSSSQTNRPSP